MSIKINKKLVNLTFNSVNLPLFSKKLWTEIKLKVFIFTFSKDKSTQKIATNYNLQPIFKTFNQKSVVNSSEVSKRLSSVQVPIALTNFAEAKLKERIKNAKSLSQQHCITFPNSPNFLLQKNTVKFSLLKLQKFPLPILMNNLNQYKNKHHNFFFGKEHLEQKKKFQLVLKKRHLNVSDSWLYQKYCLVILNKQLLNSTSFLNCLFLLHQKNCLRFNQFNLTTNSFSDGTVFLSKNVYIQNFFTSVLTNKIGFTFTKQKKLMKPNQFLKGNLNFLTLYVLQNLLIQHKLKILVNQTKINKNYQVSKKSIVNTKYYSFFKFLSLNKHRQNSISQNSLELKVFIKKNEILLSRVLITCYLFF